MLLSCLPYKITKGLFSAAMTRIFQLIFFLFVSLGSEKVLKVIKIVIRGNTTMKLFSCNSCHLDFFSRESFEESMQSWPCPWKFMTCLKLFNKEKLRH